MSQAFGGMYKVMLFLHLVTVVVAFGGMVLRPLMVARSRDADPGTRRSLAGWMAQSGRVVHLPALVLAGLFGLGMVFSSKPGSSDENVFGFDQAWVSLSVLVWIALCGVVSGMLMPAERKLAAGDGDPNALEKKIAIGDQVTAVLFLIMLYLMIWKPGF